MSRTTKSTTVSQSNPDWNTENQAGTRMRITKWVVIVLIVAVKRTPPRGVPTPVCTPQISRCRCASFREPN